MAIRFQTDPLVAPRAARTSALRAAAERANEIAAQAELTTASLEGGALADMRADQAARTAVSAWLGGAPATETVSLAPQGRTIAETPPAPPRPLEMPQAPQIPTAAPQQPQAPGAPMPAQPAAAPPPTSALRAAASPPPPAPMPTQRAPTTASAPAQRGPSSPPQAAGMPAPATPPTGNPAGAGAGNPIVQRQSNLTRQLIERYAAMPGGGTAALRMAAQEANRQLAVLGSALQLASSNPQAALMLLREHGVEVTPETQMMLADGALRQRTLQALSRANARYGPGARTAIARTSYLEGELGGGGGGAPMPTAAAQPSAGGPQIADGLDRAAGLTETGPNGPTRDPFNGGRMVIMEEPSPRPEDPLQPLPTPLYVPPADPGFREDYNVAPFTTPFGAEAAPLAAGRGAGGAGATTTRTAGGAAEPNETRLRQDALRWATQQRIALPGVDRPAPLPAAAHPYAAQAYMDWLAGNQQGYEQNMDRARRVAMGQPADPPPGGPPDAEEVQPPAGPPQPSGLWDRITTFPWNQPEVRQGWDRMWGGGPPRIGEFLRFGERGPDLYPGDPGLMPYDGTPDPPAAPPQPQGPAFPMPGGGGTLQGRGALFGQRGRGIYPTAPTVAPQGIAPEQPAMRYDEVPKTLYENGTAYEFSGHYTPEGRPLYLDSATGQYVVPE